VSDCGRNRNRRIATAADSPASPLWPSPMKAISIAPKMTMRYSSRTRRYSGSSVMMKAPDDGSGKAADAADSDHQQNFDRLPEGEVVRIQVMRVMGEEGASKSGDDGGDDKRLALVVGEIDTACARCVLVQHDRLQRTAEPAREQPMERDESRDQNGEAKKVISVLAFERPRAQTRRWDVE